MPLNPIFGRSVPRGPLAGGIPAGGPRVPKSTAPARVRDHRSKKSYTGTVAGMGRPVTRATSPALGPAGPRAHGFHSVGLPARKRFHGVPPVEFHPHASTRPPSLMTRIGARARRSAAALGL